MDEEQEDNIHRQRSAYDMLDRWMEHTESM